MIELQRKLMGDRVRNDAFAVALKKVIKPGSSTVLDLGSGTGFLSFLASRLGAKHCTLIESGEILDISQKLAKRNGIKSLTFIRKHSTDIGSQQADIVISETLGNYALEENIVETLEDGKRFLKPGGVMIPGKITQFVCPVISDRLYNDIDVWPGVGFDLDFSEAREMSLHNIYVKTIKKEDLLAENKAQRPWDTIDFSKKNKSVRMGKELWKMPKPVTVYGFALWWDSELVPGVHLSTSPFEKPTHWEQIFLPLLLPVTLAAGSSLELRLNSDTRWSVKINLEWSAKVMDATGKEVAAQKLDMRKGYIA